MSNTSWRHHYIPQFYLKGFTSNNGTFKIFDVVKNRFIKGGKDFFPESYFFEINSNTVIANNEKDDFIEDTYMKFDGNASEILYRIIASTSSDDYNLSDDDIAELQYFIGLMYWRIPTNRDLLKTLVQSKRFKDFGLKFQKDSQNIDDENFENEVKNNPNFLKFIKYVYPSYSYYETFDCNTPIHIISMNEGGPLVCGDNPIICRNPDSFNIYTDDLIFPLCSTRLFIRGDSLREYSENEFSGFLKILMDTLIYKQAVKYVSCTDVNYLYALDEFFDKHFGNLAKLRESVMKGLLNYNAK